MGGGDAGLEPRNERTARRIAWVVTGIGVVVAVIGAAQPVSFGWFGWAPVEPVAIAPAILVHPIAAVGLVIAVVGALATAYLQGRLHGRRRL